MQGRHPLAMPSPFGMKGTADVFERAQPQQRTGTAADLLQPSLGPKCSTNTRHRGAESPKLHNNTHLCAAMLPIPKTHLKLFHAPLWRNHSQCISANHPLFRSRLLSLSLGTHTKNLLLYFRTKGWNSGPILPLGFFVFLFFSKRTSAKRCIASCQKGTSFILAFYSQIATCKTRGRQSDGFIVVAF